MSYRYLHAILAVCLLSASSLIAQDQRQSEKPGTQTKSRDENAIPRAAPTFVPQKASREDEQIVSPQVSELTDLILQELRLGFGPALPNPTIITVESTNFFSVSDLDQKYTVAHVSIGGLKRVQIVLVFNAKTGKLEFNSAEDYPEVTDVTITTFGADSGWLLWLRSWNAGQANGSPLHRKSVLVPIDGKFQCALNVDHFANDEVWTSTPEQAKAVGASGLFFVGTDRKTAIPNHRGKDLDGRTVIPALVWDGQYKRFIGAKEVVMSGPIVFRVNPEESKQFVETVISSLGK